MDKHLKDHPWFWSLIISVAVAAARVPFMSHEGPLPGHT